MPRRLFSPVAAASDFQSLRPLIVVGLLALLVFTGGTLIGGRTVSGGFDAIEHDAAVQRGTQQLHAFEADLGQLAISTRDYAEWDEAYKYVHSFDPAFISTNLTGDTLGGMKVDVVMIVSPTGEVVYSGLLEPGKSVLLSPAPPDLLADLLPYAMNNRPLARLAPSRRVIRSQRGPIAVAVSDIARTDKSNPTGYNMLFGRLVNAAMINRVRRTSELPVHWIDLADTSSGLSTATRAWSTTEVGNDRVRVEVQSPDLVASYVLISTPDNKPLALLASEAPRRIAAFGRQLSWALFGGLAVLLVSLGAAVTVLVLRLHRSHKSRETAEARYRKVADQLSETILLVDSQSFAIVEINQAALNAMGYAEADIQQCTAVDLFPDLSAEVLLQALESGRLVCQSRLRCKDGSMKDSEVTVTEFRDDGRRLLCLVGHDVGHRKAAAELQKANERKLLHMAQHDPLTGMPNRLFLRSRFPRVIRHAQSAQRGIALIYLDVDHFKNINDSLGHGHGDRLLQIIAQRLRNTIGAQDAVVRMGGDEFVVVATLLPEAASIDGLAQRIQGAVCAPIVIDDTPLAVTASMGIAVYPRDGLDLEVLLKHSDIALYQAKEAGRHCHRFFAADMDLRVSEDVALEQALRHGLGTNQFHLEFQPVVDLRTNRVASVEALLRWQHPELGLVPPSRFVPIAERSGLISQLGQFVIENVLRQMRIWLDAGVACVPVAINVAPQQLARSDFAALVKRLTSAAGIEPRWLRFEITESALLQNVQQLVGTLTQLREIGSQILIDDFGTGYSGLSYLTRLPVDTVKIDRSFVANMMKDAKNEAVIAAIIEMAAKLSLVTIAEGVESREQALRLRKHGCTFAQGYFFSRPLSPRRCRRLLQKLHAAGQMTQPQETLVQPAQAG